MVDLRREEDKAIIKEAFKEWLDDHVKEFGWWSIKTIGAFCLGAFLVYIVTHGLIK